MLFARLQAAKIKKVFQIFYKNIYFCKSFSNGRAGRVFLCRKRINYQVFYAVY